MRTLRPFWWSIPLLLLLTAVAVARGPVEKTEIRTLLISEHPFALRHDIFVSGQVSTVLRFEQKCDPARTKLLDEGGRFEPLLIGGKKVVLEPLQDLAPDEWVPLLVTLEDGTAFSFLVRPPRPEKWGWTDHQVNVFKNRDSYNAMLSSLHDSLKRERGLREENERLKQEEGSVDHAFATLLAHGQTDKTPFRKEQKVVLKNEDMDITVELFSGPGKAAVVVHLTNTYNHEPWRFRDAQLTSERTSPKARPFALRLERAELVHGQSGRIAVVADQRAFESTEGLADLTLEIFREDGLQEVTVLVDHTLIRK
ncbi:DUF2381 family protein [Archangium sp.]|uniref:DUF2381 family protein n=1 Tax=Archangium sp. TaxID=1872627 RepID=UPI00286CF46F|nr:DUF2381 family protein [Archangium sp.]